MFKKPQVLIYNLADYLNPKNKKFKKKKKCCADRYDIQTGKTGKHYVPVPSKAGRSDPTEKSCFDTSCCIWVHAVPFGGCVRHANPSCPQHG